MTTHLAAAQARAAQATADREVAEAELLEVMASIAPIPAIGIVDGILPRRFEALLEGKRPYWELSQAYSAFRRCQRLEAKARSVACRARLDEGQRTTLVKPKTRTTRRHKVGLDAPEVMAGLREMRAA
jgi:hypothetical protein